MPVWLPSRCGTTIGWSPRCKTIRSPTTTHGRCRSSGSRRTGMPTLHEPVMVPEVVELLAPSRGGLFVDCTVGLGGHAAALLDGGAAQVLGVDRDETALALARERLAAYGDRVALVHAD